jgi:hypothetical protein
MITHVWLSPDRLEIAYMQDDGTVTTVDTETCREQVSLEEPPEVWDELDILDDRR